ncbi:MAG: aspartate aminotransferase family protein [Gammaproteobacteria bacterium]|nr:aspartate aminotransferase family protein [Gammaproteobacteria bacterium]
MSKTAAEITRATATANLEPYWMPFTHNRYFKQHPRMLVRGEGAYVWSDDGRKLLDGLAGLWCCHAGHCHPRIVAAVQEQVATLDYATAFQFGHPKIFALAEGVTRLAPPGLDHAFFVNSGSEAVDTALKIALAFHRMRGEGHRTRFIGREKAYHGVGFGGISVGGMMPNRKLFGAMLPGVDHLPHTHSLTDMAFSRGQPQWGAHLADELERIVALHDASNIAAVIVEPMQGSVGVIVPPQDYLQRLRAICDKHGLLLIFDEVITGFGRLGTNFAAQRFNVVPDMITFAKGVTNGVVPMGGVLVRKDIYDTFMTGPEHAVEFFHGYTYSGHPLAAAAGLATLDVYEQEELFARASRLESVLEDAVHSLKGLPNVVDIRNIGLAAAVELAPLEGKPGVRAMNAFLRCWDDGVLLRQSGEALVVAPPFITRELEIEKIVEAMRKAILAVA